MNVKPSGQPGQSGVGFGAGARAGINFIRQVGAPSATVNVKGASGVQVEVRL